MRIYDRLEAIAGEKAAEGYLRAYQADMTTHDRRTLDESKLGQRYLWILRDCGTEMFHIASGKEAIWATYWLRKGQTTTPSLPYLVTVTADGGAHGLVVPTDYDTAIELANEPHPEGKLIKISLCG